MVKTVFFSVLNSHKNVAFLIDCCDGSVNKFPFIRRQLKEEVIQREDDGLNLFALNFAKYGNSSVECWSPEPRFASVGNVVQAAHWINDRVGLSSFGSPKLIPAITQVVQSKPDTSPVDCITVITDHRPQECFGDILLALEVRGQMIPLNVVYLHHISSEGDTLEFYRNLCLKSGGDLKAVELSCEGDLVNCDVIVENSRANVVHKFTPCFQSCFNCLKETQKNCMSTGSSRSPSYRAITMQERPKPIPVPAMEPYSGLTKNAIVLARRNDSDGYFYLAKVLDSSLAHEKLVEFLETPRPEVTKCSNYDLINIREAMTYSMFPGSRVLGKIDTQKFCPGTVLHGSLDASAGEGARKTHDNLVIEYCNGEIIATAPSRLVRIPESQFYWLQKFFNSTNQCRVTREDLDINAATAQLGSRRPETRVKAKLDRFFGDEEPTTWHRHMYSQLPHYDFDRNKYENDKQLIKWYQERYRKPVFLDSDSEPDEDTFEFTRQPKKLQLRQTWHDHYLSLRRADSEREWYKKLLKRENEIMRRRLTRRPKSAFDAPPAPWRQWLKQGQEPPAEYQRPPRTNFGTNTDDRSTSRLGMHIMPSNKHDSLFKTPGGSHGRDVSVKRLLIQTDPNNPPGSRDHTEAIYSKRW